MHPTSPTSVQTEDEDRGVNAGKGKAKTESFEKFRTRTMPRQVCHDVASQDRSLCCRERWREREDDEEWIDGSRRRTFSAFPETMAFLADENRVAGAAVFGSVVLFSGACCGCQCLRTPKR